MLTRIQDLEAAQKVRILAAGTVTGGTPRFEQGFFGVPEFGVASGNYYTLAIEGVFDIALVGSPAVGDPIYITRATQAMTLSSGAGNTPFGKIVALPSGGFGAKEPAAGRMWVRLLPQLAVQP